MNELRPANRVGIELRCGRLGVGRWLVPCHRLGGHVHGCDVLRHLPRSPRCPHLLQAAWDVGHPIETNVLGSPNTNHVAALDLLLSAHLLTSSMAAACG